MPLVRWGNLPSARTKSSLIEAQLGDKPAQLSYELLQRLLAEARPGGQYALRPGDGHILVAFERENDTSRIAGMLDARQAEESSSVAQWTFVVDPERLKTALPRGTPTGTRTGSRKVRQTPF